MEDRVIDLSTMLQLMESRSDYIRIARNCLLPSQSVIGDLNRACDADENNLIELCPASEAATELHDIVVLHLQGQYKEGFFLSRCFLNTDSVGKYLSHAIRSLLSLPCWSNTPWKMAKSLVLSLQDRYVCNPSKRGTASLDILFEIEMFLSTCRLEFLHQQKYEAVFQQCQDLLSTVINPTLSSVNQTHSQYKDELDRDLDTRHLQSPLRLLPCILDTTERLEQTLFNSDPPLKKPSWCSKMMNQLMALDDGYYFTFPEMILPLTLCCTHLNDKMSKNVLNELHVLLRRVLVESPTLWKIPKDDISEIIPVLTHLYEQESFTLELIKDKSSSDHRIRWEDILLLIYDFSYKYDFAEFQVIESIMMASISTLSVNHRSNLIDYYIAKGFTATIASSVRARILLVILHIQERHFRVLQKNCDDDMTESNIIVKVLSGLLLIACDDLIELHQTFDKVENALCYLQSMLQGFTYVGKGIIQNKGKENRHPQLISGISELIYDTLILRSRSAHKESSIHYAEMWIGTITRYLSAFNRMNLCSGHMLIVASTVIVIFHECQDARGDFVIKYIVPALGAKTSLQQNQSPMWFCMNIVAALMSDTNTYAELEFIKSTLFIPLIEKLQDSIEAGDTTFAVNMASLISHCVASGTTIDEMVTATFDKVFVRGDFNLYLLKTLFETMFILLESGFDEDKIIIYISGKITNFIVHNQPSAPYTLRCEILMRLSKTLATKTINTWIHTRIIHATLFRILEFFHVEAINGCQKLRLGSHDIPIDLVFTPRSHLLYLHEELINLIKIICVSIFDHFPHRSRYIENTLHESETEHGISDDVVSASLLTLINFINNPTKCTESFVGLMEDTEAIASLCLIGTLCVVFENEITCGADRSTASKSPNLQDFIVYLEKNCFGKIAPNVGRNILEKPWFVKVHSSSDIDSCKKTTKHEQCFLSLNDDLFDFSRSSAILRLLRNRIHGLLLTSFLSTWTMELTDDDTRLSDYQLNLVCSISLLLGHYRDTLVSRIHFAETKSDKISATTVFTLNNAKRIFQISSILCRNHSRLSILSDKSFAALHHIFRTVLDLIPLFRDVEDLNKRFSLDSIVTSVWDLYFIFIDDEQHSDLIDLFSYRQELLLNAIFDAKTKNTPERFIRLMSKRLLVALHSLFSIKLLMSHDELPFFVHVITTLCEFIRKRICARCQDQTVHLYDLSINILAQLRNQVCGNEEEFKSQYAFIESSTWTIMRMNLTDSVFDLWNTLCENDALLVPSMEKTIFISVYEIPALIRRVDRAALRFPSNNSMVADPDQSEYCPLAMALCHLSQSVDNDNSDDNYFSFFLKKKSHVRQVSVPPNKTKSPPRLNFHSLCLDIINSHFRDFLMTMRSDSQYVIICSRRLAIYSGTVVQLLSILLSGILQPLLSRAHEVEESQVPPTVYTWPLAYKKKYCSCVEYLLLSLSRSMRLFRRVIKDSNGDTDHNTMFQDPRLCDSAALLIVWFHPTFDAFVDNFEHWYKIEMSTIDGKQKTAIEIADNIIKLYQLLEHVELDRLKLIKVLQNDDSKQQVATTSVIFFLRSICIQAQLPFSDIETMLSRTSKTNHQLGQCRSTFIKKRPNERPGRKTPFSSNPLVSEWLDLDKALMEKGEGGGDDVFEDLNDFLVDG